MKQLASLLFVTLLTTGINAQTANAVVFSENGEKFTLILNGEKKNDIPSANVKLSDLTSEFYQARVDFEDPTLPDFTNKNFAVRMGSEVTYVIRINKKGEYVMRFQGEAPLVAGSAPASATLPSEEVRRYAIVTEEAAPQPATSNVQMTTTAPEGGVNQTISVTETTTTTGRPATENVGVNMNVGGVNMGVNVNTTGMEMDMHESTTTTVTTTTRTTTTGTQPAPAPQPVVREEIVVKGCSVAMDRSSFERAKKSVSDKGFDDTRLSTARQVAKSNCLSTAQIKEIMGIFGFEDSKLQFAKFAYDYCIDKGNYFIVGDAFSFSSSVEELNEYIDSK